MSNSTELKAALETLASYGADQVAGYLESHLSQWELMLLQVAVAKIVSDMQGVLSGN